MLLAGSFSYSDPVENRIHKIKSFTAGSEYEILRSIHYTHTRCNLQSRIQISNPFSPQNGSAIWLSRTQARYMEGALLPLFSLKHFAFMSFIASSCHHDNKTLRQPVIRNHTILLNQESPPLPLALCIHSFHCFIVIARLYDNLINHSIIYNNRSLRQKLEIFKRTERRPY